MKTLSLLQPWASLVVMGHKKVETRSWNTKHRGLLLIHASKKMDSSCGIIYSHFCMNYIGTNNHIFQDLPFGAIIGSVNLIATVSSNNILCKNDYGTGFNASVKATYPEANFLEISEQEVAFGDYSPNRYGWILKDHKQFNTPILCKGHLGLWEPDIATMELVNKAMGVASVDRIVAKENCTSTFC